MSKKEKEKRRSEKRRFYGQTNFFLIPCPSTLG
jgi:hypothetical protein